MVKRSPDTNVDQNGGASSAALIRRAALWASPIVIATAIVVSDRARIERSLDDNAREIAHNAREVASIREELARVHRDISDRMQFIDHDGIRDPVVRMAIDRHVENLLRINKVLTQAWARRLHDHNKGMVLPEE